MERKTLFKLFLGLFLSLAWYQTQGQHLISVAASYSPEINTESHLGDFLRADFGLSADFDVQAHSEFSSFVRKLKRQQQRYKSSRDFLRFVYFKVHNKFLRRYQTPVNFSELFRKGGYDCLTGTALYAMIFKELGFSYEITETTYHVYLTVYAEGNPILIESTNPLEGFMDDPQTIGLMIDAYKAGNAQSMNENYEFKQAVYQNISLYQLSGLHHYNLALKAYNEKQLSTALKHMEQALRRYPSDRLDEVMSLMISTLAQEDKFDLSEKQYYLSRYAQPQLGASSRH